MSKSGVTPQLNVYANGPIKDKLGWSLWTLTSKEYSEAYAGLTFSPAKWVTVSGSLGLESADNPIRGGASVWMGRGRWSLLSIQEYGGSGYWYRYLGKFQATKTVAVGVNSTRFLGTGPYAEKRIEKFTLWGTYAVDNKKGVAGIRFNF
ncbi:MAG: hypothetical protein Q8P49_02030 [Candidatus Liptonbacteria bacterium]|nr:hypothetical protein [Candidatus Liptonbacteria bacterium]